MWDQKRKETWNSGKDQEEVLPKVDIIRVQALYFNFARVGPGSRNFNGNHNVVVGVSMEMPSFTMTSFQSARGCSLVEVLK